MTACGRNPQPSLDELARRYVRLAVALGERDPDSLDFYAGPADAVADVRRAPPSLPEIRLEAGALAARVSEQRADASSDRLRAHTIAADLHAIIARVDLLTGTRLPYNRESVALFGMAPAPIDERQLEAIRSRIAGLIGGRGRLVDRYAGFAHHFVVPSERLQDVLWAALDECRRRTIAHVTLPAGEGVTIEFVHDRPWSAFSRYHGHGRSTIQINADFRFTVDQLLQMACHEGYPGHHTRNTLMAPGRDAIPAERSVQLMFTPQALESEAAAMLAADVAFPSDERVGFERSRLFPLARLDAAGAQQHVEVERLLGELQIVQSDVARRYLDGELEFARAVTELEDRALVPHAEAQVKYINQFRSYVTTYTAGRAVFAARSAACGGPAPAADARWRCFLREAAMP